MFGQKQCPLIVRCDDYNSCTVWADYHEFGGDPCNKTRKYIEVHYFCHDGTAQGSQDNQPTSNKQKGGGCAK